MPLMTKTEEEHREHKLAKLRAIGAIRKILIDGNTWSGKTLHQSICLIDDALSEEIMKL